MTPESSSTMDMEQSVYAAPASDSSNGDLTRSHAAYPPAQKLVDLDSPIERVQPRDSHGRLLPGHTLNAGRRKDAIQLINSISKAYPPERVLAILDKAERIAEKQESYKGMIAVVETVLNYVIGKPRQRVDIHTGNSEIAEALLEVLQRKPQEHKPVVIDGEIGQLNGDYIALSPPDE